MRINAFTMADETLCIALPTKSLIIDGKGYMKIEDYDKEGECKTTVHNLRNCTAFDFVNMIKNDLKK